MSATNRVKQRLQAALKQQHHGLLNLAKVFKQFDTDHSGSLSWDEFCTAIQKCGLAPSPQDMRTLFLEMDKDANNEISYSEFISSVRGEISQNRKTIIRTVFDVIDKDGDGIISMTDIGSCFSPKSHPDVKSGRISVNNLTNDFFESFGSITDTGYVRFPQFLEFYSNIAAFDDDLKFSEMMKCVWLGPTTRGPPGFELKPSSAQNLNFGASSLSQLMSNPSTTTTAVDSVTGINAGRNAQKPVSVNYGASAVGNLISESDSGVLKNLTQLREQLISRGARGFIGLQRKFRSMDDDGSKALNLVEFKKALKEMALKLTDMQMHQLFAYFDADKSGTIDFDEFLVGVRGEMSPRRKNLVTMAFRILDKDGSGEIEPEDLVGTYNASKHPEFLSGKRTEEEILREFLDTFDVGGVKEGKVVLQEFINYYNNISASIDNDDYFELMIRNAWHISGGEGAAANSANRRVLVTRADGSEYVEEIKNDLGLRADDKAGMMDRLRAQGVGNATSISTTYGNVDSNPQRSSLKQPPPAIGHPRVGVSSLSSSLSKVKLNQAIDETDIAAIKIAEAGPSDPSAGSNKTICKILQNVGTMNMKSGSVPNAGVIYIVQKLKREIGVRGSFGFIGLQRKFRIMDDDGSKSVSMAEFKKAMKEMNMSLTDGELRQLFDYFDVDRSGSIDFEEFIQGVRDPLNERRLRLVQVAFSKLDKDGSGIVDAEEMASLYDASKHPEVLAGRTTPKQVLATFLDTFDVGGVYDGKVTMGEFINYYTNLGANIDNDDYFELMIRNAWHISGGEGAAANSANRRVLVTRADGSEYVEEIKNDLGLRADDKAGMMDRLKAQNVFASQISLGDRVDSKRSGPVAAKPQNLSSMANRSRDNAVAAALPASKPVVAAVQSRDEYVASLGPTRVNNYMASTVPISNQSMPFPQKELNYGLQMLLNKIKLEMKARGAHGFIGLQRKFRIVDDDNSKSLSLAEFKKALKEMNFSLNDADLRMVFDHFDSSRNGFIDFEEFIQGFRDPLTERRLKLVKMAFSKLDKDGSGVVDAEDMSSMYDASKHPDVLSGRKSAQDVLYEFLDTFDVGGVHDGKVTMGEFVNYYTNLGANIDNDDYFELMIRNAWHISGGEGAAANSANRRVLVTRADGSEYVEEIKNDLGLRADDKAGMMDRLRAQGANNVSSLSLFDGFDDPQTGKRLPSKRFALSHMKTTAPAGTLPGTVPSDLKVAQVRPKGKKDSSTFLNAANVGVRVLIDKFKAELSNRGAHGFIGLQRKFRIMDDDGSKSLSMAEFKKGMKEMNINMTESELRVLFDHFDVDRSSTIDFEEFIQGVRDPLTPRRLNLVKLAFARLDKNGSGIVDGEEIASLYDASRHPDVIAGRSTPQQVLATFLDTFDVGGVHDGKVTLDEFINYYTNIGANIDNDDYFELMIRNAWHISGGEGAAANSANRRVLVTRADGSEYVEEIKNDLGLRADDKAGMMDRLRAQGVGNATSLSTYNAAGDVEMKNPTSSKPVNLGQLAKDGRQSSMRKDDSMGGIINPGGKGRVSRKSAPEPTYGIQILVDKIKAVMKARGAAGFVGLQRKFRSMDDDGNKSLNIAEFKKGMKELNIGLADSEIRMLFDHFDADHNGSVNFEELLQGVRNPLTERRLKLVHIAFSYLDKNGSGIVDAEEVASLYDASKHPDVIAGRRTSNDVFTEFLDTFDVGGVHDGKVTRDEFINYYTNLGANIDNDDYFELMIRNAWHISGGEGAAANSANRRVLVTRADGSEYVEEIKNDLGLRADDKAGMMDRLKKQNAFASQIDIFGREDISSGKKGVKFQPPVESLTGAAKKRLFKNSGEIPVNNIYGTESKSSSSSAASNAVKATVTYGPSEGVSSLKSFVSKSSSTSNNKETSRLKAILEDLKIQLRQRGAKGFIGLQRKFRIMDDNGDQALSYLEFKKAMKECALNLTDEDLQMLFKFFDADGNGLVDFNEFLYGLKGPMSDRRVKLVDLAFDRLDRTGDGLLEPDDIIGVYNASRHPDVLTGRRSEEDVLKEFLDTFDIGGVHDGKVTREEFHNYYSNIGASIDNDDYFELMIRNAWHISGGEGAAANSANRRVLVTRADGSEYVEEIKSDLGLRADDKAGMMDRLRAQGVGNATSISTYDSVGTKKKDSQKDQQLLNSKSPEFIHRGRRNFAQASQIKLG